MDMKSEDGLWVYGSVKDGDWFLREFVWRSSGRGIYNIRVGTQMSVKEMLDQESFRQAFPDGADLQSLYESVWRRPLGGWLRQRWGLVSSRISHLGLVWARVGPAMGHLSLLSTPCQQVGGYSGERSWRSRDCSGV